MKKTVPNLIRIESSYEPIASERLLLWRYNRIIDEGYSFPIFDFYCYCALLIRHAKLERYPEIMLNGTELKPEIKFQLINFQINNDEEVSKTDKEFHLVEMKKMLVERKKFIKKEIRQTKIDRSEIESISPKNSEFYRTLLILTREFTDITLMDWFIPIVLTYERLIHIFIRHVEETKFADGKKKRQTFFDYEPNEIWTLLKTLIKYDKENIENHFLENSVHHQLERKDLMTDYLRNYENPIVFNGDSFVIRIDKNGFIKQFYQL
ncbi:hypothetical protein ACFQ0I_15305 [Mariniflexile aquimaris]|uniref:Uncharacterized protein n=1 Tax=Mariniflexile aquimaris TaxID=881009 RepID=A0ABW3BVX6_9FLAO